MNGGEESTAPGVHLATTVVALLEDRYGRGQIPSVRSIAREISEANGGEKFSHGLLHNILRGSAGNITTRTIAMLSRFFGVPAQRIVEIPVSAGGSDELTAESLAFRLASFSSEELAAVDKVLQMVLESRRADSREESDKDRARRHGGDDEEH